MTIEQLEEKFEDCFDANTRATEGGYGPDTTSRHGLWMSFQPIIAEYAKQQSIEFFKWYALRMASFIDYFIKRADPIFKSEEIEQSVKEHEGATIEQLYSQFSDNQFVEQQNKP